MTLTDRVVRETLGIAAELAYFSIVLDGKLRLLFLRHCGARGQGIWVRRVLPDPKISPAVERSVVTTSAADGRTVSWPAARPDGAPSMCLRCRMRPVFANANMWFTWCEPCIDAPSEEASYEDWRADDAAWDAHMRELADDAGKVSP